MDIALGKHTIFFVIAIFMFTAAPDVNPIKRLILLYIVTLGIRGRYYFGWLIGKFHDAIITSTEQKLLYSGWHL